MGDLARGASACNGRARLARTPFDLLKDADGGLASEIQPIT
jgi:hypothetical protein